MDIRKSIDLIENLEKEVLAEGKNHPVIIVDVQPEYCNYGSNESICYDIMRFVSKQTGKKLMFVNAEETGVSVDTIVDIRNYWDEYLDYEMDWDNIEIVDKGYGHFRSWMDNGISDATIIKVIRTMYQQRVNDSRDIFEDNEEALIEIVGDEFQDWMIDDPILVGWAAVDKLKEFNGAYIVGGGRNECLREVELLMNAFNISYKRIDSLVY